VAGRKITHTVVIVINDKLRAVPSAVLVKVGINQAKRGSERVFTNDRITGTVPVKILKKVVYRCIVIADTIAVTVVATAGDCIISIEFQVNRRIHLQIIVNIFKRNIH
jgi:hypothetical protein